MKTIILRVVSQGVVSYVPSQKAEGGQLAKCVIRLREPGGKYGSDEFLVTLLGNLAGCTFNEGDLVVASLRFQVHEVNGNYFQDITANDIIKLER